MKSSDSKEQSWNWSNDHSKLLLKNSELFNFIIICGILILPTAYLMIRTQWHLNTGFYILIVTSFSIAAFLTLIATTTSFQKEILVEDIDQLVDKKSILFDRKIAIQLKNRKYRTLRFDKKKKKREFISQLTSRDVDLVHRKHSWSLPINI